MSTKCTRPSLPVAIVAATLLSTAAGAQSPARLEVRPFVGAFIPTGDQRDFLEDAVLTGAEISLRASRSASITVGLGWSPSKDRITSGSQTIDIYQYDVGVELRPGSSSTDGYGFSPFVGSGIGGRTYNYRDLDIDSGTNFVSYAALGGDIGLGAVSVRVAARDYVSQFKPITGGGDTRTRNDIGIVVGLGYRF
jgi:hypothetical protein